MIRTVPLAVILALWGADAHAQTKEQWIELGTRIHGGFGALIPIGIRIGLDANERLKLEPRGFTVTFYTGQNAPCPCIADGVMIATGASPGQGTLHIAPEKASAGLFASIVIRNSRTGEAARYNIPGEVGLKVIEWNRSLDPSGRFDAAMNADGVFQVNTSKNAN
jgi:hypothetical protein